MLSGCHARPVDYSLTSLSDGALVKRIDASERTNQFISRYRVTLRPDHPILRCELEHYKGGKRAKPPLASLEYEPQGTGPVDVTISIGPVNTVTLSTGKMSYFIKIADKSQTTVGDKIFRNMIVQGRGSANLPLSFGDRWYLVAANHTAKEHDSSHSATPLDDNTGITLHMTTLSKDSK